MTFFNCIILTYLARWGTKKANNALRDAGYETLIPETGFWRTFLLVWVLEKFASCLMWGIASLMTSLVAGVFALVFTLCFSFVGMLMTVVAICLPLVLLSPESMASMKVMGAELQQLGHVLHSKMQAKVVGPATERAHSIRTWAQKDAFSQAKDVATTAFEWTQHAMRKVMAWVDFLSGGMAVVATSLQERRVAAARAHAADLKTRYEAELQAALDATARGDNANAAGNHQRAAALLTQISSLPSWAVVSDSDAEPESKTEQTSASAETAANKHAKKRAEAAANTAKASSEQSTSTSADEKDLKKKAEKAAQEARLAARAAAQNAQFQLAGGLLRAASMVRKLTENLEQTADNISEAAMVDASSTASAAPAVVTQDAAVDATTPTTDAAVDATTQDAPVAHADAEQQTTEKDVPVYDIAGHDSTDVAEEKVGEILSTATASEASSPRSDTEDMDTTPTKPASMFQ